MSQTADVVPGDGFNYYRPAAVYWNSYPIVVEILNERATGDPAAWWGEHLRDNFGPFRHALVLNCGNGWVERALIEQGIVESAVGVDVSDDLLEIARGAAADVGASIRYERIDTNTADFPDEQFDLVVNHAAMHHVAYIDRVTRRICELLPPEGVFVSWDYVGPHRNQYTALQWEAAWQLNQRLPVEAQQIMTYPHLPTMLASDPTEAVHSELILPTMERYFRIDHRRDLGGGVAYLLLTHNEALHAQPPQDAEPLVRQIMAADSELVLVDPSSTLFSYIVARPEHDVLAQPDQLERWALEENERERNAATSGGVYYPRTAVASLSEAIADVAVGGAPVEPNTASVLARTPGTVLVRTLLLRLEARLRFTSASIKRRVQSAFRR